MAIMPPVNPTPYNIYLKEGGLYSAQIIPPNTIIGELVGDPDYIWNVKHNNYIIIDDELVLDVSRYNSNMLTYVREENLTSNLSNTFICMKLNKNGQMEFKLVTKSAILPDDEIVYSTFDFMNIDDTKYE